MNVTLAIYAIYYQVFLTESGDTQGNLLWVSFQVPTSLIGSPETTAATWLDNLGHKEKAYKREEYMIRDYFCWVFSFSQSYLSKSNYEDLSFSTLFIKANAPLYDYLGHKLRFNMPQAWISTTNRSNNANRRDKTQNSVYQKCEPPEPESEHKNEPEIEFELKPELQPELT